MNEDDKINTGPLDVEQQCRAIAALIARDVLAKRNIGGSAEVGAWEVLNIAEWIITGDTDLTDPTDQAVEPLDPADQAGEPL